MNDWLTYAQDEAFESGRDRGRDDGQADECAAWVAATNPLVDLLAAYGLAEGAGCFDEPDDVARFLPYLARDLAAVLGPPQDPEMVPDINEVRDAIATPNYADWRRAYYAACVDHIRSGASDKTRAQMLRLEDVGGILGLSGYSIELVQRAALEDEAKRVAA